MYIYVLYRIALGPGMPCLQNAKRTKYALAFVVKYCQPYVQTRPIQGAAHKD